jgi:hypothetical protein
MAGECPNQVPYSDQALAADLQRLNAVWEEVQSSRERKAIYRYLGLVFDLVEVLGSAG